MYRLKKVLKRLSEHEIEQILNQYKKIKAQDQARKQRFIQRKRTKIQSY